MSAEISTRLEEILETYKMKHVNDLLTKYKEKRKEVKELLEAEYSNNIYSPLNSGSYAKHTAINSKFDLDILIPFKRDSFNRLEDMFDTIYSFLFKQYGSDNVVRKQSVSIGLKFKEDKDGDAIDLDIVPGRELNKDKYAEDKQVNLYVNATTGILAEKTYLKTNIDAQIQHIKGKSTERQIIRLLKIWKSECKESYKSFLLELLVIKAFDKVNITGNLWEQFKLVAEYIKNNVTEDGFKLLDPGNSGNNVMDTLNDTQRSQLSSSMKKIVKNIEENINDASMYFPKNTTYQSKNSNSRVSIPPKTQRFG